MSNYNNLLGLEYIPGKQDCYSIVRRYFDQEYGLKLRNYARPDRFWEDQTLDLYKMFVLEGARPVHDGSIEIGDVILCPILTPFATHALIVVGDNLVLHHPPGRLSCIEPLRPRWISRALNTIRHPAVSAKNKPVAETVHLHEVLDANLFKDPGYQATLERVLGSQR
jgi:cell wall-associated NlpC family hydrolase